MRVLEVSRQLATPFALDEMLARVVEAGRAVLGAERGTVFLYDAARDELFSSVATGTGEIRFPASRGIAGECARTRTVINVPDCYADPRFNQDVDRATGYRTRCLLAAPLVGHDGALVGVMQLLNKEGGTFSAEDTLVAETLAAQCAVALQRVRLLADTIAKERMEKELSVARDIQMRVLPSRMPSVAGYDLDGWCRPADQTGGDIYDALLRAQGSVMLLLGDATGHGIGPALSVTQMRAMLRVALRLGAGLDAAYEQINNQLAADLPDNRFVTAFLGELDPATHTVTYRSGGQAPILHYHADTGRCEWLGATSIALGMIGGVPLKPALSLALAPGDILGLLTDGFYEYGDVQGEMFGEERVGGIVRQHAAAPMAELRERIIQAVDDFASGAPQGDDMTILLARRLPS